MAEAIAAEKAASEARRAAARAKEAAASQSPSFSEAQAFADAAQAEAAATEHAPAELARDGENARIIEDTLERCRATLARTEVALAGYNCPEQHSHYNAELRAPNVWEVEIPHHLVDEARELYQSCRLREAFAGLQAGGERHVHVGTCGRRFFALRSGQAHGGSAWKDSGSSDITYISADDAATYATFESLFERMGLEQTLAPVIQPLERLRLYSAKFVVRSRCAFPCFHSDWPTELGARALTLMTPLDNYKACETFNLLYCQTAPESGGHESDETPNGSEETPNAGEETPSLAASEARYVYKRGTAVCFGASFGHSTEPGATCEDDGAPHAYLCFTFGTDDPKHWPLIADTIGNYTRVCLRNSDGSLVHTRLGVDLEPSAAAPVPVT